MGMKTLIIPNNPGAAHVSGDGDQGKNGKKIPIKLMTLDSFVEEERITEKWFQIHMLKVDVETLEPEVFAGAKDLISSGKVKLILHELSPNFRPGDKGYRSRLKRMLKQLIDSDYQLEAIHGLERTNIRMELGNTNFDTNAEKLLHECGKIS